MLEVMVNSATLGATFFLLFTLGGWVITVRRDRRVGKRVEQFIRYRNDCGTLVEMKICPCCNRKMDGPHSLI